MDRRSFLSYLSSIPVGMSSFFTLTHASPEQGKTGGNYGEWYNEKLLRFMIGQHTPDTDQDKDLVTFLGNGNVEAARKKIWQKITPQRLVNIVKNTGAEVFYFYSKCHFGNAYYPSKTGHVHSILQGEDFFGEVIDCCKKEGIVPAALYECADMRIRDEKPEWCSKNENGSASQVCFNSPYCDFVLAQAEEIWSTYDLASLYFDMVDFHGFGTWSCPYCQKIFQKEFGFEFKGTKTMSSEVRVRYQDWCQKQVAVFLRKLKNLRDKVAPTCGFEHNFHGLVDTGYSHGWKDTKELTATYMSDIFAFRDGSVVDAYYPKAYRNANPAQKPFILVDTSFGGMTDSYDQSTPRPYDFYQAQTASVLANQNAFCSSICIEIDGTMDPTQAEMIRRTNDNFKPKLPYYKNTKPVYFAAIVYPGRSRDIAPDDESWRYPQEFTGWIRLLEENQILYDVIADELLEENSLDAYKLLFLPNVEALSDLQIKVIEAFVHKGGTLIVTGNTSIKDWMGRTRSDFGLKEILGVSLVKPIEKIRSYIYLKDISVVDEDLSISPWIYLPDGQSVVTPLPGTGILAMRGIKPNVNLAYLRYESENPSLTKRNSVYYFAGEPGLAYCRYQYPAIYRLIGRILKPCKEKEMPIVVTSGTNVQAEASLQDSPQRLLIHLINRTGNSAWTAMAQKGGSRMYTNGQPHQLPPIYGIEVRIKKSFWRKADTVFSVSNNKEIPFKDDENDILIPIERLDVFDIITVS
ncbi:MAG: beta-galactosidase trimerization domain-containing protein [Patescibacteria group bacterium]|nr:beta-galactosidase trimerization domain-containing protein [Patescibacteria group bacterium]